MTNTKRLEALIDQYDRYAYYLEPKIARDIEQYRKGQFLLRFVDASGAPVEGVRTRVRQTAHEFKFGCSLFHLDQFPDEERNEKYKEAFKKLFNYAVVPFYWDTLEPTEGRPRFDKDCAPIYRRPPIDSIMEFCEQNRIQTKGHCLVYNSFQPDWIPDTNRGIKEKITSRIKAISERYDGRIADFDVINEMLTIYKNCYKGNGMRNLQITDERDHEQWAFELCRRYFPLARLFWNEGIDETFGQHYRGHRSFYYMTLEKMLAHGVPIDGIGMQYHLYNLQPECANPLRVLDVLEKYGEFGLPIHLSEVSIPSMSNGAEDEALQAELTGRLLRLWFSQKHCEAVVWWNLADNTAYHSENVYHAGIVREDCSPKPAYTEIERLIQHEWNTSLQAEVTGELRFGGFYGEYEVETEYCGKKQVHKINLFQENTGYDNRLMDFRAKEIVLR